MAVAIAPDGMTVISASWDKTIKIWDIDSGIEMTYLTNSTNSWYKTINWDIERGIQKRNIKSSTSSVNALAIAPDGKTAIFVSSDGTVNILDKDSGMVLRTLIGHTHRVNAVAIAPDGKTAISVSDDKTLKIWDTKTGWELKTLTGSGDRTRRKNSNFGIKG